MQTAEVIRFPTPQVEMPGAEDDGWDIEKLKRSFREAEEAHQKQRELAFRDRDYYDNFDDNQWTEYEKNVLKRRRQQVVTANKIKAKVNALLGHEQRSRSDPRAWPNKPDQEKAADIATDVLDFIENNVRMDRKASVAGKDLAISGIEACEVTIDPESEEIAFEHIPYDRFFYDPRSLREDFVDARYMGYCEWMDEDVAKAKYPDREDIILACMDGMQGFDTGYEDKPWGVYADQHNKRVRVVVMYYRQPSGAWMLCHFTAAGVLFKTESPWPDEKGRPACGIIAQSVYVDRRGNRYGAIRDDISTQNEINQRKSRSLHLLSDRRTWGVPGWTDDVNAAKEALARPDGHVSTTSPLGTSWGLIDNTSEVQGNLELLQQAIADMEVRGVYQPGDSGRAQDQSGRAILALQQAGLTAENGFFDAHNDWKLRVYRRFWSMAQKYWTQERTIRVTGDNEAPKFVNLNQFAGVNELGIPVVQNPISEIDVDITIEAGPDTILHEHEQFEQLISIVPQIANLPPQIVMMLISASRLRNKRELLQQLEAMYAQMGQQSADPTEQAEREAEIAKTGAETDKIRIETARMYAEAQAPQVTQGRTQ